MRFVVSLLVSLCCASADAQEADDRAELYAPGKRSYENRESAPTAERETY